MTSTRLTQHTRSREWAAALRAATHRPHRPLQATRGTAPTATRQYIHSTSTQYNHRTAPLQVVLPQGRPRTRPTHAHGWAGGTWVLRSGCADPIPARSHSGAPRAETARRREGGGPPPLRPPSSPALSNAIDLPRRRRVGDRRARRNPASRFLANLSQAGGDTTHESGRAPPRPLPPGPDPPSTRAVLAAPLGVTRDTRKGRDARAAPQNSFGNLG